VVHYHCFSTTVVWCDNRYRTAWVFFVSVSSSLFCHTSVFQFFSSAKDTSGTTFRTELSAAPSLITGLRQHHHHHHASLSRLSVP